MDDQSKAELREAIDTCYSRMPLGDKFETEKFALMLDRLLAAERTAALACVAEKFDHDWPNGAVFTDGQVAVELRALSPESVERWRKRIEVEILLSEYQNNLEASIKEPRRRLIDRILEQRIANLERQAKEEGE